MSEYYNSQRTKGLYDSKSKKAFKLSRSKIELFIDCPRCFYFDRVLGVSRPPGYPFALNSAVDYLLKKEFDIHRAKNTNHPLIEKYGIDAHPIAHSDLEKWRQNFVGIQYLHQPTNLLISGAIDDLWQNSKGEYIVVDYKSTSKVEEITVLDRSWQDSYKRQLEIYQWLLRRNSYPVSDTGYFVYCNGKTDREAFDAKLEFDITLIPHIGQADWVEGAIQNIHRCLNQKKIPSSSVKCDYCSYIQSVKVKDK